MDNNMKREPLLSDIEVRGSCSDDLDMDPIYVRDTYEAELTRLHDDNAKLIQKLVNYINHHRSFRHITELETIMYYANGGLSEKAALDACAKAGFVPNQTKYNS